ncbi:uncharacterized protein LOC130746223 [Lotus japonicus]|uniref:uncharacterized protein LOC130746223 n=1 Tax=Lotus japonicus TaxID=34305 RepID=UPI00258F424A|nr:uncharacterized protein LOC130746223 [Lotus japonicus]
MAAFDHFGGMDDVELKPRLLRTLISDHLRDKKRPSFNPSALSKVISLIRTHSLLSESFTESMAPELVEEWKSAVTSWVERIETLLESSTLDKCWAGISLLGVTCELCSDDRFVDSYSSWFDKLKKKLQPPADSDLVRVACCASISDLFARLSGFPKLKKDCVVKVVQPVLRMLQDDNSEAILEAAVHVLCTILTSFRSSIQHHDNDKAVESAIASKLLSGGFSPDMLKNLVHCLALLPKSRGDEESWSLMMQKVLILINDQLNLAFQGLEEDTKRNEVSRLLVPPGTHPPPPLGGHILAEASNKEAKRSEQSLMSNVSVLMFGCCTMLTNSYPVKVNVPVRSLLALVERILSVNGSLPQMSFPFMTSMQQENICSELPVLHLCSMELLMAVIKGSGSELIPHAASIVRIITQYFKTCALPELRIKVYSVTKTLLISMGVGIAMYLEQEVVNNAIADLSTIKNKNSVTLNGSNSDVSVRVPPPTNHRKRKHSSNAGSLQEHVESVGLGVKDPKNRPLTPISLRIAALEALEALVTVAGALRSERWRQKVDSLLMDIANDSFKEGPSSEEISVLQQKDPAATAADLQLAALRALLASFLSFARVRPPYISQGLGLFRRGRQQTGTKLAEFCAHALLTLEVLIHPRALPLLNYDCAINNEAQRNFQDEYTSWNSGGAFGLPQTAPPDYEDNLYASWLGNGNNEADMSLAKEAEHTKRPSEACRDNDPKVLSANLSSDTIIQERSEMAPETATGKDVEMRTEEGAFSFMSGQPGDSTVLFKEPVSCTTSIPDIDAHFGAVATEISERVVSDSAMPDRNSSLIGTSDSKRTREFAFKLDYGSSEAEDDPFPAIVDADPDTDSE